jgi:hypothetical protein
MIRENLDINNLTFAEEFKLYENLFAEGANKQTLVEMNKADFNNLVNDFNAEVEKISKGKSLADIAWDLVNLLRSTISELKVFLVKNSKANELNTMRRGEYNLEEEAEHILVLYKQLIKSLKKPSSFLQAYMYISNTADQILGDYSMKSSAYKKIEQYNDILTKIYELQADKKVKAYALKEFFESLLKGLADDYKQMEGSTYATLFTD